MEEKILKLCDFCLPIHQTIFFHLLDLTAVSNQKYLQPYFKTLNEILHDPAFMSYSSQEIAEAVVFFE